MNRNHRSITSEHSFEQEMRDVIKTFQKKEGEETWEAMNKSFLCLNKWVMEDNVIEYASFMKYIEELKEPIKNSLMTKRTILSGNAVRFLESISLKMKDKFDPINTLFIPTIMTIFGNNNKVQRERMLRCYKNIIQHSKVPRMITKFATFIVDKKTRNNFDSVCILECLNMLIKENSTETIKVHLDAIERLIMASIQSAHMDSRMLTRSIFRSYKKALPEEWEAFNSGLVPQLSKKLNMAIPKKSSLSTTLQLKKKSVATATTGTTKKTTTIVKRPPIGKTTQPTVKRPLVKSRPLFKRPIGQTVARKEANEDAKTPVVLKSLQRTSSTTSIKKNSETTRNDSKQQSRPKPVVAEERNDTLLNVKEKDPKETRNDSASSIQGDITTTASTSKNEKRDSIPPAAMVPSFSTPSKRESTHTATLDSRPASLIPQNDKHSPLPSPSTSLPTVLVTNNRVARKLTVPDHPPSQGIKRQRSSTGSTSSTGSNKPSKIPLKKNSIQKKAPQKENIQPTVAITTNKRVKFNDEPISLLEKYKNIGNSFSNTSSTRFKKPAL
ncbi:hypothetical protein K501DRAFT_57885 [Backusella circina FSU 941]|nr:hypothetical protein K501DRAFT_57885 [Backusella circina FSU 941]